MTAPNAATPSVTPHAILVPDTLPDCVQWLQDMPLFIDDDHIERFYDAVARPVVKVSSISKDSSSDVSRSFGGSTGGEVAVGLGPLSQVLTLGMLEAKAKGQLVGQFQAETSATAATRTELVPITSAGRQLEHLTMLYFSLRPTRIKHVATPATTDWREPSFISATPRALVFLDLQPGSKIIPTAAEVEGGKVILFYDKLKSKNGESQPDYPEQKEGQSQMELLQKRKEYWTWFNTHFSATAAMVAVENVVKEEKGRIRWIDYRVSLTPEGDTLHLHVCPAGKYDTGVFAYNLIKRGHKHGLRLVGTLKSEPDMNVLAIFEK